MAKKTKRKSQQGQAAGSQQAAVAAAKRFVAPTPKGNARALLYLNVPFSEKETAKNLGARWDAETQFWYVPHGYDIHLFQRWWPAELAAGAQHLNRPPLRPSQK